MYIYTYIYIKHKSIRNADQKHPQYIKSCNNCTKSVSTQDNCHCIAVISSPEEINCNILNYGYIILPVDMYGCESWSLTLREEYRQIVC